MYDPYNYKQIGFSDTTAQVFNLKLLCIKISVVNDKLIMEFSRSIVNIGQLRTFDRL